jgi:ketosteroid isomerase-like protein
VPPTNAEVVEQAVAAVNETYRTGDTEPWRRYAAAQCAPDMLLEAPTDAFTEGEWRGPEGAVAFVANQMEVLEDMWLRVDEHIEVGDDDVIVLAVTFGGRARHSGLDVELHPVHVFRRRNGLTVRWEIFLDRSEALEAARRPA